ncbi:proline dehydrogenase family protein [Leptobacterium sp. I13]|uniref:proline dehydrogenase family protein n=1 Tax=Leptobacterium meishanense TaxID=3128904 RepID=UPI0030EE99C9
MNKLFDNTEIAFASKSNTELKKTFLLFKIIANPLLVKLGTNVVNFLLRMHLPIKGIIKSTIFKQFCGGTTVHECETIIKNLSSSNISSILDYSVEGKISEVDFERAAAKKCELIMLASKNRHISFVAMKPTALGRFALWEKITANDSLSDKEEEEWRNIQRRIQQICHKAYEQDVPVLIDAEESWMQDAADELVEEMMKLYNKESVIVYNTIQCYRWDRLQYVKHLKEKAVKSNFLIGTKLVRGAYMEKENLRAMEMGRKSPICESKEATDSMFNDVLTYVLDNLDVFSLFVGSHNEESTYLAIELMKSKGLANHHKQIWFGQLYGMSEQITYNLAAKGYNATKLIPFGPIREVIPYLTRRAQENTSVAGQSNRELSLLQQEMKRRNIRLLF